MRVRDKKFEKLLKQEFKNYNVRVYYRDGRMKLVSGIKWLKSTSDANVLHYEIIRDC